MTYESELICNVYYIEVIVNIIDRLRFMNTRY